jgi:DUF4097 and DUF4098 domain-containing protein YvlB
MDGARGSKGYGIDMNSSSRTALVAMLIAVEVLIAGLAIWCIGGGHTMAFAAGMHRSTFVANPIAPINAGDSPRIDVSDSSSRVVVNVSHDGLVHVKDLTTAGHSFLSAGTIPQLHVNRTAGGVSIDRADYDLTTFGFSFTNDQRIEVDVPAAATLNIAKSAGADVSGITGGVTVRSQDGHIVLADLTGTVDAASSDGYVKATGVHGDKLTLQSSDGNIELRDVTVETLNATTSDGRVETTNLTVAGGKPQATLHSNDGSMHVNGSFAPGGTYEVSSNDGRVELGLAPGADLTVAASTDDGKITVDGTSYDNDDGDSVQHTVRLGSGAGTMNLRSGDGSIHITTNGAI